MRYITLCVLNDNETFTDVSGCKLIVVREDHYTSVIDQGGDAGDLSPLAVMDLSSMIIVPNGFMEQEYDDGYRG